MAKLQPIPPVPEVHSVFALLDFLRDPKAVEERLKKLEDMRNSINARIEAVGKVDEIQALRGQAATDRQSAKSALDKALEDAAGHIGKAKTDAEGILHKARDEAQKLVQDAKDALAGSEEKVSALVAREVAVSGREESVKQLAAAAEAKLAEAAKLKDEFEGKLAKLKAAGVL